MPVRDVYDETWVNAGKRRGEERGSYDVWMSLRLWTNDRWQKRQQILRVVHMKNFLKKKFFLYKVEEPIFFLLAVLNGGREGKKRRRKSLHIPEEGERERPMEAPKNISCISDGYGLRTTVHAATFNLGHGPLPTRFSSLPGSSLVGASASVRSFSSRHFPLGGQYPLPSPPLVASGLVSKTDWRRLTRSAQRTDCQRGTTTAQIHQAREKGGFEPG